MEEQLPLVGDILVIDILTLVDPYFTFISSDGHSRVRLSHAVQSCAAFCRLKDSILDSIDDFVTEACVAAERQGKQPDAEDGKRLSDLRTLANYFEGNPISNFARIGQRLRKTRIYLECTQAFVDFSIIGKHQNALSVSVNPIPVRGGTTTTQGSEIGCHFGMGGGKELIFGAFLR